MRSNNGFTLIELVIVIIVLGVLAAIAIPKFINIQHDASSAVVKNLSGSLKTAIDLVNVRKEIDGSETSVDYNGNTITITIVNGYPQPSAPQMRFLLEMDLPSTTWTSNWLTVPCDGSAFCLVGNRPPLSGVPPIDGFDRGTAVFFWPNGYVLESCFDYYVNLDEENVSPLIGFEDKGC